MSETGNNNFWLFLELLARRRSMILSLVVAATLIAVVVSLVLPEWYTAKAVLLPPKDVSITTPGQAAINEIVSVTKGLDLPLMVTPSDVYARILKSRTIAKRIIDRFNLLDRFDADHFSEAYEALLERARFEVTDEGLLEVSFEDKNPQLAAEIANAFVGELNRVNREIVSERINRSREFVGERLLQVKAELDSAREAFKEFQLTHRAIDFDEQTRLAVEQAIGMKVKLAELDIDIKMKEATLGADNAKLKELKRQRETIQDQIEQLETRNPDSSFFSLPISAIPTLRGQYEVLYSRVRVQESLYRILLEQLEQVKFQQQETTPNLSVLDSAVPPEQRSRPQRTLIVVGTFVLALLFSILLAAVVDYVSRLKRSSPEDYRRVMYFLSAFFGWLPGIKRPDKKSSREEISN